MSGRGNSEAHPCAARQSVSQAAVLLGVFAVLSGMLGYIRESLAACLFGPGAQLDAYLAALMIPTMANNILNATLPVIFISLYHRVRHEAGEGAAWTFAETMFKRLAILLAASVALCMLLARALLRLLVPGLDAQALAGAQNCFYLMAPTIFFSGLFIYCTAILHAVRKFFWPALLSLGLNLAVIAAMACLGKLLGVVSLAVGMLAGNILQLAIVLAVATRQRSTAAASRRTLRAIRSGEWMNFILPGILMVVLDQGHLLVVRNLGSYLEEGSISIMYFTSTVMQLLQMVIIVPACRAFYPEAAQRAAGGDLASLRGQALSTARIFLLVALPILCGIIILRDELVQVLFVRGAFNGHYQQATARLYIFYALALIPIGFENIMQTTLFTLHRVWSLLAATALGVGVNWAASLWLIRGFQTAGLALADLLSHAAVLGAMAWIFWRETGGIRRESMRPMIGILCLSLATASVLWLVRAAWAGGWMPGMTVISLIGTEAVLGAAVYLGAGIAVRQDEMIRAVRKLALSGTAAKMRRIGMRPTTERAG